MNFKHAAHRYKETNLVTRTEVEHVLVLLNECLCQTYLCEKAIQSEDRESLYACLTTAQQLLFELMATADRRTVEGERLLSFYAYLNQCLVQVRLNQKLAALHEVLEYLQEMIKSWEIAKQKSRQQNYTSEWI
ncbi:flagellar protein FliS [Sporosarcina sp. FSL K6-1522]|uniref:flagellar protein FliS n=1 Tax=Sporosarcina sp. FSL K6-1522 TaxID=2921554 RepID=UPI003159DC0A